MIRPISCQDVVAAALIEMAIRQGATEVEIMARAAQISGLVGDTGTSPDDVVGQRVTPHEGTVLILRDGREVPA